MITELYRTEFKSGVVYNITELPLTQNNYKDYFANADISLKTGKPVVESENTIVNVECDLCIKNFEIIITVKE